MISKDIEQKAKQAWVEYGKAICRAFGFKGDILAAPLLEVFQTSNEEKIQHFIQYIRERTLEIKSV